jgi:hypothetical protein
MIPIGGVNERRSEKTVPQMVSGVKRAVDEREKLVLVDQPWLPLKGWLWAA